LGEKVRGSTTGRATPIANPPVASITSVEGALFTERFVERLFRESGSLVGRESPERERAKSRPRVLIDNLLVAETGKRRLATSGEASLAMLSTAAASDALAVSR
jgi:hypothetical protein